MSTEDIKTIKEHLKLEAWSLEVKQQQESGMSATSWCKLNGLKPSSYFHRLKRVREAAINKAKPDNQLALREKAISFAEIDITSMQSFNNDILENHIESNIKVTINGTAIEIPSSVQLDFVAKVLRVVKEL